MRPTSLLHVLVPAALALAVPPATAAPGPAHGSFAYSNYWLLDYEESSCTETSTAGPCSFGGFTVAGSGSTCAKSFGATLRITSGLAGPLEVPGTLTVVLGGGVFTGSTVKGGHAVVVQARYSGPLCGLPTFIPVDTHLTGTYDLVTLA